MSGTTTASKSGSLGTDPAKAQDSQNSDSPQHGYRRFGTFDLRVSLHCENLGLWLVWEEIKES